MKTTRLRTVVVDLPIEPPMVSAIFAIHSTSCILCFLETDQGLVGEGLVLAINGLGVKVLHEMVRSLEPLVLGLDPTLGGSVNARAWKELNLLGYEGVTIQALAGIAMALWDLRGKAAELNVSRLIGAVRHGAPVYAAAAYGSHPRSTNCSAKPRTSSPLGSGHQDARCAQKAGSDGRPCARRA
jgi:L-alanine-DL-glutamate epimerase-like enolase superfamily enzyme